MEEEPVRKFDIILSVVIVVLVVIALVLSVKILLKYLFPAYELTRSDWAFECTEIVQMNAAGYFGVNVTIGIIDTGINTNHPDLSSINISAWKDFINYRNEPYDDNGHGTHIAGILAANGKITGIIPYAKLIVVKALKNDGTSNDTTVAKAVEFCMDPNCDGDLTDGADVICLSLGGKKIPALGSASERACQNATSKGTFVVAAAGNDYPNRDVATPGTVELVFSVGAIDENKKIAVFSSKGWNVFRTAPNEKPELVAPGVHILSTWQTGYAYCDGTSQSAPFVAGSIALILDALPHYQHEFTNSSAAISYFKRVLADSAEKLDAQDTPHDTRYGYGLVQVWSTYNIIKAGKG